MRDGNLAAPTGTTPPDSAIAAAVVAFLGEARTAEQRVVGITGPVAVGKSHLAAQLCAQLDRRDGGRPPVLACTDSWLLDETTLASLGRSARKGFPESYDVPAMRRSLTSVSIDGILRSPRYSHLLYDIEPDVIDEQVVGEWLVVEGLHLTRFVHDLVPVIVHLDAPDEVIERWYVRRLKSLIDRARNGEPSFYAPFTGFDDAELDDIAGAFWHEINLPNKHRYIDPLRTSADLVITVDAGHRMVSIVDFDGRERLPGRT